MKTMLMTTMLMASLSLAGCGKSSDDATTETPPVAAAEAPPPDTRAVVKACNLLTAEEIAAIAGKPLRGTADDGVGRTGCIWEPEGGGVPHLELKIDWGSAEAAMQAQAILSKMEKDLVSPYDDLGDEAWTAGPMVMIKRGDDLFQVMAYGTPDAEVTIKKLYETAAARL